MKFFNPLPRHVNLWLFIKKGSTYISKSQLLIQVLFLGLVSCSFNEETPEKTHLLKEAIVRYDDEHYFLLEEPQPQQRRNYPWEEAMVGSHPRITEDFFRCKGSTLNPVLTIVRESKEPLRFYDCGGRAKHGLPLKGGQEFIYPILIELLNYIQGKTGKRVVITTGYRCPKHNLYADPRMFNKTSKHMIGAEVDFYVQGMENDPHIILELIWLYYQENHSEDPPYKFKRYTKSDVNVSTQPWYNKEIFVKYFQAHEGRDMDNRHGYPYISLQVRYDKKDKKLVTYTWKQAYQNYLRY